MFDIIENKLHTLSDQGILETDGMIKIKAYDKKGRLTMKNDSTFLILLPTSKKRYDMETYIMKSDTAKYWEKMQVSYKFLLLRVQDSIVGMLKRYKQANNRIADIEFAGLSSYYNIIASSSINALFNIDALKMRYRDFSYRQTTIINEQQIELDFTIAFKELRSSLAISNSSARRTFKISNPVVKSGLTSYLCAYRYDVLKTVVYYDIVDITNRNNVHLDVKVTTVENFKTIVNNIWK